MNALFKLGEMPTTRVLVFSLLIAGAYYLIGIDFDQPKAAIATVQQQIADTQTELVKVDKELLEIRQLKEAQERDAERLNTLLSFIPEKLTKTELMRTLSNEAKAVGASINGIRDPSGAPKQAEFYEEIGIDIDLTGGFAQLVLFLANLTRLNQILTLDSLDLRFSGGEGETILTMSAQIRGYRYITKPAGATK